MSHTHTAALAVHHLSGGLVVAAVSVLLSATASAVCVVATAVLLGPAEARRSAAVLGSSVAVFAAGCAWLGTGMAAQSIAAAASLLPLIIFRRWLYLDVLRDALHMDRDGE